MRIKRQLLDNWVFRRSDEDVWTKVVLPHTFNLRDGIGNNPYYRGKAFYQRELSAKQFVLGRRYFLLVEAACLVAEVRLGGKCLATHRGGFTGFYVEIDSRMFKDSPSLTLEIEVDNGFHDDVAPLAGDFNLFGGLYREVHLIETYGLCFTPSPFGGDGIRVDTDVHDDHATLVWNAWVSGTNTQDVQIRTKVVNAEGESVAQCVDSFLLESDQAGEFEGHIRMKSPILWQGVECPYLYEVVWELLVDGEVVDRLSKSIGLRTISQNERGRLLLNGRELILRGTCKHQEVGFKCSAVSSEDIRRDLEFLLELGANAVRLAHYPHSQATLDLCDRMGLLVWCEVPLVDKVHRTEAFRETTTAQLREMIEQNRHHASIFAWSLFNEIYAGGSVEWDELFVDLHQEVKRRDPRRFTVCASHRGTPDTLKGVTDLFGANLYCGWYAEKPEDMAMRIREANASAGSRGMCVSEYGAGSNPWHHEEPPLSEIRARGFWHPEEWQCYLHERQYEAIRQADCVWGSFVWVLADFFSSARNEGGVPGINDKGLVSLDRSIRKDAFYFYKAHWSKEPVLWITSKRHFRIHSPLRELKVYSNVGPLAGELDGQPLDAPMETFGVVYTFTLPALAPGEHRFVVRANTSGTTMEDQRRFELAS